MPGTLSSYYHRKLMLICVIGEEVPRWAHRDEKDLRLELPTPTNADTVTATLERGESSTTQANDERKPTVASSDLLAHLVPANRDR